MFVDPGGVVDAGIPAFLIADGELVAGDREGEGKEEEKREERSHGWREGAHGMAEGDFIEGRGKVGYVEHMG